MEPMFWVMFSFSWIGMETKMSITKNINKAVFTWRWHWAVSSASTSTREALLASSESTTSSALNSVAGLLSPFKKESCCGVILDPRTGNAPGCACCGGDATWSCWWECSDKDIRRKVVILRHLWYRLQGIGFMVFIGFLVLAFHFRLLPLQTGFHCCIQQNFLATSGPAARSWNIVALSNSSSFASSAKGWAWSRPAVEGVAAIAFYPHSFACHGK